MQCIVPAASGLGKTTLLRILDGRFDGPKSRSLATVLDREIAAMGQQPVPNGDGDCSHLSNLSKDRLQQPKEELKVRSGICAALDVKEARVHAAFCLIFAVICEVG